MKLFRITQYSIITLLVFGILAFLFYPAVSRIFFTTAEDVKWANILTPEQYYIMREGGTETPYSSPLNSENRAGTYYDATGEQALFRSEDKFDSGTGWPSFTKPISPDTIIEQANWSLGFPRTEVLSSNEGHHLGHVFTDGPEPTGLRYCLNGVALTFVPDDE